MLIVGVEIVDIETIDAASIASWMQIGRRRAVQMLREFVSFEPVLFREFINFVPKLVPKNVILILPSIFTVLYLLNLSFTKLFNCTGHYALPYCSVTERKPIRAKVKSSGN